MLKPNCERLTTLIVLIKKSSGELEEEVEKEEEKYIGF